MVPDLGKYFAKNGVSEEALAQIALIAERDSRCHVQPGRTERECMETLMLDVLLYGSEKAKSAVLDSDLPLPEGKVRQYQMLAKVLNMDAGAGEELLEKLELERADGRLDALLARAVETGDIAVAEFLLEKGANARTGHDNGSAPLIHIAMANENIPMVDLLLDYGADINALSSEGMTGLNIIGDSLENDNNLFALVKRGALLDADNPETTRAILADAAFNFSYGAESSMEVLSYFAKAYKNAGVEGVVPDPVHSGIEEFAQFCHVAGFVDHISQACHRDGNYSPEELSLKESGLNIPYIWHKLLINTAREEGIEEASGRLMEKGITFYNVAEMADDIAYTLVVPASMRVASKSGQEVIAEMVKPYGQQAMSETLLPDVLRAIVLESTSRDIGSTEIGGKSVADLADMADIWRQHVRPAMSELKEGLGIDEKASPFVKIRADGTSSHLSALECQGDIKGDIIVPLSKLSDIQALPGISTDEAGTVFSSPYEMLAVYDKNDGTLKGYGITEIEMRDGRGSEVQLLDYRKLSKDSPDGRQVQENIDRALAAGELAVNNARDVPAYKDSDESLLEKHAGYDIANRYQQQRLYEVAQDTLYKNSGGKLSLFGAAQGEELDIIMTRSKLDKTGAVALVRALETVEEKSYRLDVLLERLQSYTSIDLPDKNGKGGNGSAQEYMR